ncbi:MAG TPA: ABC transporter permease, partial [Candidatus Dormibacteraeota bacterium]|nr:ABC transporter permease [Candidatus Dormibacteraeota bacterium]
MRSLFRKKEARQELDEELRSFLDLAARDKMNDGMSPKDALRTVRLEHGSLDVPKEEVRSAGWESFVENCWQDLRFAARMLRKSPTFTAVAVLTLALGIGANTAIFSLVNGILLVSLPYSEPEQLVSVTGTYPRGAFVAMREQIHTMDMAAYAEGHEFNLTGRGEPVRLAGTLVSAELFTVLGARPELGRAFVRGEDIPGQDNYVILSHELWQQRFGSDPTIVGRSIELEGMNREVVGVMPAKFRFPSPKTQ